MIAISAYRQPITYYLLLITSFVTFVPLCEIIRPFILHRVSQRSHRGTQSFFEKFSVNLCGVPVALCATFIRPLPLSGKGLTSVRGCAIRAKRGPPRAPRKKNEKIFTEGVDTAGAVCYIGRPFAPTRAGGGDAAGRRARGGLLCEMRRLGAPPRAADEGPAGPAGAREDRKTKLVPGGRIFSR